jgi:hypothetical protein
MRVVDLHGKDMFEFFQNSMWLEEVSRRPNIYSNLVMIFFLLIYLLNYLRQENKKK